MIATRSEILDALGKVEYASKSIHPDKKALYADVFEEERLTVGQLGDMVRGCVKRLKFSAFPTPAFLLECARPPAINAPSGDGHESKDPIIWLENEVDVQTRWARHFEERGNDYGARMARLAIERAHTAVNSRLNERGLPARYTASGAEDFGASSMQGIPVRTEQRDFHDWTREAEDDR